MFILKWKFLSMDYKLDNILLVDDDAITNFVNMDILTSMGIARQVHIAGDGSEALAFVQEYWLRGNEKGKKDNNLIFLDINMPYMGAFQFLEQFERLETDHVISVVLLTTSDSERDVERARHFNVSSYLVKPLSVKKVYSVLQMY